MRPSGVKKDWDDCDVDTQAMIIAYEQVRSYEDSEELKALIGAKASSFK